MNKNNRKISNLLNNKRFVGALSFVVAVIFWLVISINQNPTREQIIKEIPISINTEGTAVQQLGLDVVGDMSKMVASVKVSGPTYIVSSLTSNDINVGVSLSQVTAAGEYTLTVTAVRGSNKVGYSILEVTPGEITVTFDNIDTKTFNVTAVANGIKATEGLIADQPTLTDSIDNTLQITGPRRELEKISEVRAVSNTEKTISSTESFDAKIELLDKNGDALSQDNLTFEKQSIKISVPIYKSAELVVKPVFVNYPTIYKSGVPCILSEEKVAVLGPPEVIDELKYIQLKPIDFAAINESKQTFEVELDLPASVKTVDNIDTIEVKLDISRVVSKSFTVSDIRFEGLASGLKADAAGTIKNVKICGPSSDVYSMSAKDIYAKVDLSGKAAGEYTVNAVICSDKKNTVWAFGTYTVIVTVK